jgi:succinoglycan biosynthesis protein ExoA
MPTISVIVPCYNEEKTIQLLLSSINAQTWPVSDLEVIIADGLSTDRTRQKINEFQTAHPDLVIRVVENPRRNIPAALNSALAQAQGEYIVRLDAHSRPDEHYIERCLADLRDRQVEMVGGIWKIHPGSEGWMAKSIASAAAHPLGVGDALYRYTTHASLVDTVPFGAYRRDLLKKIGLYDETLLTNEDYEFNTRIRQAGGKIWLNPDIHSIYYARSSLRSLAKQYWRYGYWKYQMLRRYPRSLRLRQAVPPVFVLSVASLCILAFIWQLARVLLLLEIGIYLLVLLAGSIQQTRQSGDFRMLVGIPLAIATMHFTWGAGFIGSMVKSFSGISFMTVSNRN